MKFTQMFRFLVSGLFNTAIGLTLIYTGMWFGLPDVTANFFGYSIGITISFLLNRNWTFNHRGSIAPAIIRFCIAVSAAYLANLGVMLVARDWLGFSSWIAQAVAVVPYAFVLYFLSTNFVFRK